MFANSNSYPLFIKNFTGFKIAQKERGYYYDKTLKKRIWLYTFNLRRNLFFTLKELIPFQGLIGASSITIPVDIETNYKTAQSDLLNYKRIYLARYLANKCMADSLYTRLTALRRKEKRGCLISQDVNFISFSLDSNHVFSTSGNIHKVSRILRQELQVYRYMLKKAPYKFWNSYTDFVKIIGELATKLLSFKKMTFFDFLVGMNLNFIKIKLLRHLKEKRPWSNTLFLWNVAFHKIYLINLAIFKSLTKDSSLLSLFKNYGINLASIKIKKSRSNAFLITNNNKITSVTTLVKKLYKGKIIFARYNKFVTNKIKKKDSWKKLKRFKTKRQHKYVLFSENKKNIYLEQKQSLLARKNFINDLILLSKN